MVTAIALVRFWAKVRKTSRCWFWLGAKTPAGYGVVQINGKRYKAHHVAYILAHGPLPPGKMCCHSCDWPPCVNPAHLFAGTAAENNRQRKLHGRNAHGPYWRRPHRRGQPSRYSELRTRFATWQERFWASVRKSPEGCWLWLGYKDRKGYGYFKVGRRRVLAHRLAYELSHGPLLAGQVCRHRCHVPSCVRPDHLLAGTAAENNRDTVTAGRWHGGDLSPYQRGEGHWLRQRPERVRRGEQCNFATLTTAEVQEIRQLFASGQWRVCDLAKRFSRRHQTISKVVHRKRWAHVA